MRAKKVISQRLNVLTNITPIVSMEVRRSPRKHSAPSPAGDYEALKTRKHQVLVENDDSDSSSTKNKQRKSNAGSPFSRKKKQRGIEDDASWGEEYGQAEEDKLVDDDFSLLGDTGVLNKAKSPSPVVHKKRKSTTPKKIL